MTGTAEPEPKFLAQKKTTAINIGTKAGKTTLKIATNKSSETMGDLVASKIRNFLRY